MKRLLITTQTVDQDDPILGFFHRWIDTLALGVDSIEVICLKEGRHALPANVRVHSLGKERAPVGRIRYTVRFLALAWRLRHQYDTVFVHMNQEYVLIAGWLWKLLGKPMYLWRNHYAGSWRTVLAVAFCNKVFCTSKHSYTAKYAKTVIMPVGVDTERFSVDGHAVRTPHSVLFLARMAPSKRPEMLVEALALLFEQGVAFTATFVGSPFPEDSAYYENLTERASALADRISFLPGVPNDQVPDLYRAHEIFVNCSPSGMLDKTLFEAAACGCRVVAASDDFAALAGADVHFSSSAELAERLRAALVAPAAGQAPLRALAEQQSLKVLSGRLIEALAGSVC